MRIIPKEYGWIDSSQLNQDWTNIEGEFTVIQSKPIKQNMWKKLISKLVISFLIALTTFLFLRFIVTPIVMAFIN
jgi:hypothetical protein